MAPKRWSDEGAIPGWLTALLVLLAAFAVAAAVMRWHGGGGSPQGVKPTPTPGAVLPGGEPGPATDRLLKALNEKLQSLDLLKLLNRDVETQPVTVEGQILTTYREQFRVPARYSPTQLAETLDQTARTLGARLLEKPSAVSDGAGNLLYSCSFVYGPAWVPVRIDWVEVQKPKICLIIDDGGYQRGAALEHLYGFKIPVTVAVIPDATFSTPLALELPGHGVEVMCHMPMEGHEKGKVGDDYKNFLKKGMTSAQVESRLNAALDDLPGCRGLNNHMGSVATTDESLMEEVCRVLKSRGLFIIDSRTTAQSLVEKVARQSGLRVAHRDVFLDNVETPEAILKQLNQLAAYAKKHGLAVGIGHFKLTTLQVLEGAVAGLKNQGFQFVYASEVVKE